MHLHVLPKVSKMFNSYKRDVKCSIICENFATFRRLEVQPAPGQWGSLDSQILLYFILNISDDG